MNKFFAGMCVLALSACGSGVDQDTGGGDGGGGAGGPIPDSLSANLTASTFAGNALSITLDGFDHPTASSTYVRSAGLDTVSADGTTTYRAFTFQETPQSRMYLAYFAEGSNVSAGAIATEAEAASSFGGATYSRTGTYSQPVSGTARYHGGYAGVIDNSLGTGVDRAVRTSGHAFIRVNFAEGAAGHIEGWVQDRVIIDGGAALAQIELQDTALVNGEFFGDVFIDTTDVGDYGGVLGGNGATEVAGVVVFNPFGDPNETEYGAFVLPECSTAGASPACP